MATSQHTGDKSTDRAAGTSNRDGQKGQTDNEGGGQSRDLHDSPMMAHLLNALEKKTDIGHYGRLTFAMIARHFIDEEEMVRLLSKQPDQDEAQARTLVRQVEARDYNPPKRERILEWQAQQEFPICPTPDDASSCNVYSELRFPDGIYDNINEYWEEHSDVDGGKTSK